MPSTHADVNLDTRIKEASQSLTPAIEAPTKTAIKNYTDFDDSSIES